MKISVDTELCEAHGICAMNDPGLFPLNDDGYSAVGQGRAVPAGLESAARQNVAFCPTGALRVDEP